ncbi:MAG: hypothetical protein ACRDTT_17240 [Pseudonocardiaceae bacterium]
MTRDDETLLIALSRISARDVRIVTDWFTAHGLPRQVADAGAARVLPHKTR